LDGSLARLVSDYGYLAVFVGSLLEGESILLLAAYAAHRGYLSLPIVVAVACCGAILGDQIFFFSGRWFGDALLRRVPTLEARAETVNRLLIRFHAGLIIGLRFAYGLRIAGPVVIGMSTLSSRRFLFFNAVGALIWAPLVAGVGFVFGHAMERLFVDFKEFETLGLVGLALLIIVVSGVLRFLPRRVKPRRDAPKP